MNIKFIRLSLLATFTLTLFSCSSGNNSGNNKTTPTIKAEIVLAEVSTNNCLNLEKVMGQLQDLGFQYPTAIMNLNLKTLSDISPQRSQFYSYTNFYYKTGIPDDLNLMKVVQQQDCESIQILTSSREVLNFKITEHSDTFLHLELTDTFSDDMPAAKREALSSRFQPYSYMITYLNQNSLKIIERFRTLDVLCATKDTVRFEVTKLLSWAREATQLPQSYDINSEYLATVKTTLATPPVVTEEPVPDSTTAISLQNIKEIMASPIRDDLKLCN